MTLALVLATGGIASAQELSFDWSVPDKLKGPSAGVATTAAAATVAPTVVRLQAASGNGCGNLLWELDGTAARPAPVGGCSFELDLRDHAQHDVTLKQGSESTSQKVSAADFLVVSIGDSVASGEGNPDTPSVIKAGWIEPRCHRSLRSGAAQSVVALERADRHSEISFLALACSGATVPVGLLGRYGGIEPDARLGDLPAQMSVVSALQPHQVDAVLLSVGANDVNFGALVTFCIRFRNCPSLRFDPNDPLHPGGPQARTTAEVERDALARLPGAYDNLAASLDTAKIDPKRVIIVEYFDPLRDAGGAPCRFELLGHGIDPAEAAWAEANVLSPLNGEVRAAAEKHGWRVVSGVSDAFATHGICVRGEGGWIREPGASVERGAWISGTFHPNSRGHLATAALIAPVLANTLGVASDLGSGEVGGASDNEASNVPVWALAIAAVAGIGLGFGLGVLVLVVLPRRKAG